MLLKLGIFGRMSYGSPWTMIIRDRDSFTRDEKDSFTFSLEWHLCQVFHWLISGKTIYWGQEDVAAYYVYGKMAKRIFRGFRQTQLASHHMCHHDQSVFLVCFVTLLVCLIQDMAIAWENSGKCLTICALKAGKVIIQSICPQDAKFTFNWFFSSAREKCEIASLEANRMKLKLYLIRWQFSL